MPNQSKRTVFIILFFAVFISGIATAKVYNIPRFSVNQIDSLIQEKSINNAMTKLELLVLYQNAWESKHSDSIIVFKNLAILNAELKQPKDALFFTEKYITNSLDFSVLNNSAYEYINETNEYKELSKKYLPKINVLAFLFFGISIIGFLFAGVMIFSKNVKKEAKIFIGIFIGAHSFFILDYVLNISNFQYQFPHTYLMAASVVFLFGPTLYFYFKNVVYQYKIKVIDVLHAIPFVIALILLSPIYFSSAPEKIKMILGINLNYANILVVIFICTILSLVVYMFYLFKMLNEYNSSKEDDISPFGKFINAVHKIHLAFVVFYIVYGVALNMFSLSEWSDYISYIYVGFLCLTIIYISYVAYIQPAIFRVDNTSLKKIFADKYKKSGLTESLSNELKENLINLLINEEVYKESNINLEILSKRLNTTRHNTSQIINEHFDMNFFELINKFRIKEAIKILESNIHGNLNIIDVAYEVGYNNKVTFNKAFKKETSLTPSEYLNSKNKNPHK